MGGEGTYVCKSTAGWPNHTACVPVACVLFVGKISHLIEEELLLVVWFGILVTLGLKSN